MQPNESIVCKWIGDGEYCRHPRMVNKSYCETHQSRMYITLLPEMANFILEKDLANDGN